MRKLAVVVLALAVLLVGSVSSGEASGRGGHFRGGHGPRVSVGIGVWGPGVWWGWPGPYWAPYAYPYPYSYPYYAPPVVVQQEPPVYIQQSPPAAAPQPEAQQYWYYCEEAKAYYPYVQQCPKGWMTVVPTPPPGSSSTPGQ